MQLRTITTTITIMALGLLAACATPSQRIATRLTAYGLPERQAQCMGDRLQRNLSTGQLRRLAQLADVDRDRLGRMSVDDVVAMLDKPGDEAIVVEVVRSGISCLL